jgi:hypothetical protein
MDPIHEQMHVEAVTLTGGEVHARSWSQVQFSGGNTNAVLFAGYHGEIWLYFLIALAAKRAGMFFAGAGLAAGALAADSYDFSFLPESALSAHLLIWAVLYSVLAYVTWLRLSAQPAPSPVYCDQSILR